MYALQDEEGHEEETRGSVRAEPDYAETSAESRGKVSRCCCRGLADEGVPRCAPHRKTHDADAYCIACSALDAQTVFDAPREPYAVRQYRRHDRARIKARTNRSYKLSGKIVALNRHKEVAQEKDSLEDWYSTNAAKYGRRKVNAMRSRLTATKSRTRYNNLKRSLPGSVFSAQRQTARSERAAEPGRKVLV